MADHLEGCKGEWVELHRIDPEESRPALGSMGVNVDGTSKFEPRLSRSGKPLFGARKYSEKVIVYYCPSCGVKKEEPWK